MPFSCRTTLLKKNPCLSHGKHKINKKLFSAILLYILGKTYDISLVFVGDKRSRTLNHIYRKKDKATNILSFPLSKTSGEIIINPYITAREARSRDVSYGVYVTYLFIHGLLHLKGLRHSSKMEMEEKKMLKKFLPKHYEALL